MNISTRYRGIPALELAEREVGFESAAELLWLAEKPRAGLAPPTGSRTNREGTSSLVRAAAATQLTVLERMMHLMVCAGGRANAIVRLWLTPVGALTGYLADLARTREELFAENALLRQQLLVLQRQSKKPKLRTLDRFILLICARLTMPRSAS